MKRWREWMQEGSEGQAVVARKFQAMLLCITDMEQMVRGKCAANDMELALKRGLRAVKEAREASDRTDRTEMLHACAQIVSVGDREAAECGELEAVLRGAWAARNKMKELEDAATRSKRCKKRSQDAAEVAAAEGAEREAQRRFEEQRKEVRLRVKRMLSFERELPEVRAALAVALPLHLFECSVQASDQCIDMLLAAEEGVRCEEGHFVCSACLQPLVQSALGDDLRKRKECKGGVRCPQHCSGCSAKPLDDASVARAVSGPLLEAYMRGRVAMLTNEREEELERDGQRRVKEELDRMLAQDAFERKVATAVKHVTESVLQCTCPRCSQVYLDFDGCCALKCPKCACGFCAWCNEDCGADAHRHVAHCKRKAKGSKDPFFARRQDVEAAQRLTWSKDLAGYLGSQERGVVVEVLARIGALIRDRLPDFPTLPGLPPPKPEAPR